MTEKESIEQTIVIWEEKAATGCYDEKQCPICNYAIELQFTCDPCPYYRAYGCCDDDKAPYWRWKIALTKKTRKKYAGQILNQLRSL